MENEISRVVDALPGLVWTALPDGHIDFLNQRWCEYTGLSVDEACGLGWQTAIHPEDLPELLERWRSILAFGKPREMEARLRRFDGEYRLFLFRISPLADASGQVVKWCAVSRSIIESHHGRLWAAPNDGPGATFEFSIPRQPESVTDAHSLGAMRTPVAKDAAHVMRNP